MSEGRYLSVSEIVELMNSESNKMKPIRVEKAVDLNEIMKEKEMRQVASSTAASNDLTSSDVAIVVNHRRRSSAGKYEDISESAQSSLGYVQGNSAPQTTGRRRATMGAVDDSTFGFADAASPVGMAGKTSISKQEQ